MKFTITDEQAFQVGAPRFSIGQSATGYTLNFSTDGTNWTAWTDGTLANTDQVVTNAAQGLYFKLDGNTGDVVISW